MPPPLVAARRRPPPSLSPNRSPNLVQRHRAPYAPAATPRRRLPLVPPRPLRQGPRPRVRVLVRVLVRVRGYPRVLYCPFAREASSQPRRTTRTAHSSGLTDLTTRPPSALATSSAERRGGADPCLPSTLGRQPLPCARSPCSSSCVSWSTPLSTQTICASDALRGQHSLC